MPQTNRLATLDGVAVSHDAAGNRTASGAQTLAYDQPGRLATVTELVGGTPVTVAQYVYDAQGRRRVQTTASGTVVAHYNLAGRLLAETRADGTLARRYVWGAAGPVAQRGLASDGTLQLTLLHTDHLGTPRLGTDAIGTVVWRWDSDAFGQDLPNPDPDGDGLLIDVVLRFPGQVYDPETGLHYNYFRDYDPATGRYLESDPIGLRGGLNTYLYVRNNPLRRIDPWGLADDDLLPVPPFSKESMGSDSIDFFEPNDPYHRCPRPPVAYLPIADKYFGLLASRLTGGNQPVIRA